MKKILCVFLFLFLFFIPFANAKEDTTYNLYYFMTNIRCSNCYKIENYTKEVFDELNNKNISFKVINIDQEENKHYVNDYNIYTKSVVISKIENNKEISYKNLDKIWNYLGNKNKFKEYIRTEVNNFINKK